MGFLSKTSCLCLRKSFSPVFSGRRFFLHFEKPWASNRANLKNLRRGFAALNTMSKCDGLKSTFVSVGGRNLLPLAKMLPVNMIRSEEFPGHKYFPSQYNNCNLLWYTEKPVRNCNLFSMLKNTGVESTFPFYCKSFTPIGVQTYLYNVKPKANSTIARTRQVSGHSPIFRQFAFLPFFKSSIALNTLSWAKQKISASTITWLKFLRAGGGFFFCWNFLLANPVCKPLLFKSKEQ